MKQATKYIQPNMVIQFRNYVIELAKTKNFDTYLTQSNTGKYSCISRIYIAKKDKYVGNSRSKNVIKVWTWKQNLCRGKTDRCKQFKMLKSVENYLLNEV
jgi:hypothetical protein